MFRVLPLAAFIWGGCLPVASATKRPVYGPCGTSPDWGPLCQDENASQLTVNDYSPKYANASAPAEHVRRPCWEGKPRGRFVDGGRGRASLSRPEGRRRLARGASHPQESDHTWLMMSWSSSIAGGEKMKGVGAKPHRGGEDKGGKASRPHRHRKRKLKAKAKARVKAKRAKQKGGGGGFLRRHRGTTIAPRRR